MNWQHYPQLPWIRFAACGCSGGGFYVHNTQTGERLKAQNMDEIHQYAAHVSGQGARVPLGDLVHRVTNSLGMRRCTSCAKRQVRMNRFFG